MALLDTYVPIPALACPACGTLLADDWQGTDGPCGMIVWQQGRADPVDQPIDDDARLGRDALAALRLPDRFTIRQRCCSERFMVEATGRCVDGTWTSTELTTSENALQKKTERSEEFRARTAWLSGR